MILESAKSAAAGIIAVSSTVWAVVAAIDPPAPSTIGIGAVGGVAVIGVLFKYLSDAKAWDAIRKEHAQAFESQRRATDEWEDIATAQRERANLAEARVLELRDDNVGLRNRLREGE